MKQSAQKSLKYGRHKTKKPVAINRLLLKKCPEQESNLHVQNGHMALNHACLPIPTSGQNQVAKVDILKNIYNLNKGLIPGPY